MRARHHQPIFALPSLKVMVFPEPGMVALISTVASPQWLKLGIVYLPASFPPLRILNLGWLASATTTGAEVSHELPTVMPIPATVRLTLRIVILDVVLIAPVFRLTLPVVGPSLMSFVVAVTGMIPYCLNDPVASGSE